MHKVSAVAAICFLSFGCGETATAPPTAPDPPSMETAGDQDAPQPWIYWGDTYLDYYDPGLNFPSQVETIASMDFLGNKAEHNITVSVRGSGTGFSQEVNDYRSFEYSPGGRHLFNTAFWTELPADCDLFVQSRTAHYAWIAYWNPVGPEYVSPKAIRTSGGTASGPACVPFPPDDGGCLDERDDPDSGGGGEPGSEEPCPGGGGGGGGGGGDTGGMTCHQEWLILEISYDGGVTWHPWWEGWANVCEG